MYCNEVKINFILHTYAVNSDFCVLFHNFLKFYPFFTFSPKPFTCIIIFAFRQYLLLIIWTLTIQIIIVECWVFEKIYSFYKLSLWQKISFDHTKRDEKFFYLYINTYTFLNNFTNDDETSEKSPLKVEDTRRCNPKN